MRPAATAAGPGLLTAVLLRGMAINGLVHGVSYLLNTLLPVHLAALGASPVQIAALFTVTTLAALPVRPLVGSWIDRRGLRAVLLPAAVGVLATALAFNLATTAPALIVLMGGIGLGQAVISMGTSLAAATGSAPARRGAALSLHYVAGSVGVAVGPAAGLWLSAKDGTPLALAVVAAALLAVVALVATLPGRVVPAGGGDRGPGTGPPRDRWPVSRHALGPAAVLILVTFGHAPLYAFLPAHAGARGPGGIAWFYPLMSGCTVAARLLLGGLSDRFGRVAVLAPALAAVAAGYALLAAPPARWTLGAAAVLLGSGWAMVYPTLLALVVDRAPEAERGRAVGTLSSSWDLGVGMGSVAIGAVVERAGHAAGFLVGALAALAGLAALLRLVERPASPRPGR